MSIKLSDQLRKARVDRPDEYQMDRYKCHALELEDQLSKLIRLTNSMLDTSATHDGLENCEMLNKARAVLSGSI